LTEVSPPQYSDDVKRIANAVTMHAFAGTAGRWCAFKLQDGTSPDSNTVYDSYDDAVRSMRWDRDRFVYLFIPPDGMDPRAAKAFLTYARNLHDAGYRLPAPDDSMFAHATVPVMPLTTTDQRAQISALVRK
jgi:hypothetical protein